MTQWTKDKEKRILYKYRFMLTIKILRVLAAILLLWVVYKIGISIAYDKTNSANKHSYYSSLAVEWRNPNLRSEFLPHPESEITTLLTQKINYPLYKTVGKEELYVGEVKINKKLLAPFSIMELKTEQGYEEKYSFYMPEDPVTGEKLRAQNDDNVWKTLNKVAEGTVADLAFSTDRYLNPEDILTMLAELDVDILWMPLYTGEFKSFSPISSWGGGGTSSVSPYGLIGGSEVDEDYRSGSRYSLSEDNIKESEKIMLRTMEYFLQKEGSSYYEGLLQLDNLKERYDYLKDNGFQVYGAVVTGPVKELLKLKDIEGLRGAQIGKFEYWNWDN